MFDKFRAKLARERDEMEDERLQQRCSKLGACDIAQATPREATTLAGEVQGLQVVPRAGSPSLEVTVDDGTARAVAVFTGRRRLGGVDPGRRILITGVGRKDRGRFVFLNPAYRLLP